MKTLFTRALAFTALGSTALAGPDPVTSESDWARLDREIGELSTALNRQGTGTNVGGLIRAFYARSVADAFEQGDPNMSVNSGGNLGGVDLKEIDIFAEGSVAEYDWRINVDVDSGTATLEDAYGRWNFAEGFNLVFGQFKAPTTRSAAVYPENQILPDRTFLGQVLDFWNPGAMLTGDWDMFGAFISAQNGADGLADDNFYAARAEVRLNGGTGRRVEGAFGAKSDLAATAGAFWFADENTDGRGSTGHGAGADVNVTFAPVSFQVEVAHIEGEVLADKTTGRSRHLGDSTNGFLNHLGPTIIPLNYAENGSIEDVTIYSSTASCMVDALDVELIARFEIYDDPGNSRSATVGANWYRSGKNAVWHAGITQVSSNEPISNAAGNGTMVNGAGEGIGDATLFQVGLSLGRSTANL